MRSAKVVAFPIPRSEDFPLIPEGEYRLKLLEHATAINFKSPRLVLTFSVCDFGEWSGTKLQRFYNLERLLSKVGPKGKFHPKARGDFMIEYYTLFPERKVRLDRVPMEPFYNSAIVGRVETVTRNNQGKNLPEQLQYSKVSALLRIEE